MKIERRRVPDEIPTASMADIAFLLIVYFMVTSTFAATRGLDFAFPPEDDSKSDLIEPEDAVLIEIQSSGDLLVDQKPMKATEIVEYLRPKLVNNPKKPVIIKPDPASPYGYMLEVLDELRQGDEKLGLKINISLPTQREIELFWY